MSTRSLRILMIGIEEEVSDFTQKRLPTAELMKISDSASWESLLENLSDETQDIAICGSVPMEVSTLEIAQVLRSLCPGTPLIFASASATQMAVKALLKNGFNHTFLIPNDEHLFGETLVRIEALKVGTQQKVYRGVTLVDVEPGDPLDFNVSIYLPMNNKYVKVLKGGDTLSKQKFERFQNFQVSKVFVESKDMDKFYSYTAEKLKDLNTPGGKISETERQERLATSIRNIVLNLFDSSEDVSFDQGKALMADTQKIITEMIGLESATDLQSQLNAALNQPQETSSRANRVATFAALFEMAVGLQKTQMAAIAGLFLDLGLATLPRDLQSKPYEMMTPEEKTLYGSHPSISLKLLQEKKMIVPPEVQNAILHHHERLDGSGFPNKLNELKISQLAQVVALADRFEALTFEQKNSSRNDMTTIFNKLADEKICSSQILNTIRNTVVKKSQKSA